ncbi:hypothetical protein ACOME3_005629 [Neoechinorhynchus agilis]
MADRFQSDKKRGPAYHRPHNTEKDINAALRKGEPIEVTVKQNATKNIHGPKNIGIHIARVDRETEAQPIRLVDLDVGRTIQRIRTEKGWKQVDLAKKVNETASVINEMEQGKAIYNAHVLGKLEQALGVKLRGKGIGEPLHKPKTESKAGGAKKSGARLSKK